MKRVKLLVVALSIAVVTTVFFWEYGRVSPGPLSPVHARIPDLAGTEGCVRCHGPSGEPASACGDCHEGVQAQVRQRTGFHGQLRPEDASHCGVCHVEHHGEEIPLVGDLAFRSAGIQDGRAGYDHRGLGFRLTGRHAGLACSRCHTLADAMTLPAGGGRFTGLSQVCSTCHRDPHGGDRGEACEVCHGQDRPFADVTAFSHPAAFPLEGAHGRPKCGDCHPRGTPRSVGALLGTGSPVRACAVCHEADYLAAREPDHGRADFPRTCADCHGTVGFQGAEYAHDSFPLDGAHRTLTCTACHVGGPYRDTPSECNDCHSRDFHRVRDPHHVVLGFPRDCRMCHGTDRFAGASFRHAFPIDRGKHRRLKCTECHSEPRNQRRYECIDCHAHSRGDMSDEHRRVRGYSYASAACFRCHPSGVAEDD